MIRKEQYIYCTGGVCGECENFRVHLKVVEKIVEYHCVEDNNPNYLLAGRSTIFNGTDFELSSLLGVRIFIEGTDCDV